MSIWKSPWFWGTSALGLLFMNSKSKADELNKPKPVPPSSLPPVLNKPPAVTPAPAPAPKPAPVPSGFQRLAIPSTATVQSTNINGHSYRLARLGGGVFIYENNRAYIKFDQDIAANGPLATGGATQADLDQLLTDFRASANMPLTPAAPGPTLPAHPHWSIPDSLLAGLDAATITNIDAAYASKDPLQMIAWADKISKTRPDLAGTIRDDAKALAAST